MEVEANMEIPVTDNGEKKRNFKIDFTELFGEDHDDEPEQELVVVPDNPRRRKSKKERKLEKEDDPPSVSSCGEDLISKNVHDLKSTIDRINKNLSTLSGKLPDGGAKLKAKLQAYEDELKRRQDCRSHEVFFFFLVIFLYFPVIFYAEGAILTTNISNWTFCFLNCNSFDSVAANLGQKASSYMML